MVLVNLLMEKKVQVKLISYSKPSRELVNDGLYDVQELIAFCARVSNPANQFNTETSEKLIKYLVKHQHWSPLEMVSACIEVVTTRDIARQILRHRSFSFQEFSQRYADPTAELSEAFVLREARFQDTKNRQNSIDADMADETQRMLAIEWERAQKRVLFAVEKEYKWAIANGIAKEQARAVLPEGLTVSRMYMNGTLRSWIHFITVRSGNGTQKEHMLIAREVAKVIAEIFPLAEQFVTQE
jgi:thymidylate synthase (FAD)